jgi:heme exporter protein C
MATSASSRLPRRQMAMAMVILCLLMAAILLIFFYAPTEATMGDVQRILYIHVSVAWCGLAGCLGMGTCGAIYLLRRRLEWDHWSQAAAEAGWLGATLTLVTGSLWAHEAWGVWWTWEPRLTALLVLWLIFAGIFLVRAGIEDPHRRARIGAVLAMLAVADIPLVVMATRWFRGMHPVAPEMDQRMRFVLLAAVVSFTAFFAFLVRQRRCQLELLERTVTLEAERSWAVNREL